MMTNQELYDLIQNGYMSPVALLRITCDLAAELLTRRLHGHHVTDAMVSLTIKNIQDGYILHKDSTRLGGIFFVKP